MRPDQRRDVATLLRAFDEGPLTGRRALRKIPVRRLARPDAALLVAQGAGLLAVAYVEDGDAAYCLTPKGVAFLDDQDKKLAKKAMEKAS